MESIEGSYMSIARWVAANWSDLTWFPLWFNGMPMRRCISRDSISPLLDCRHCWVDSAARVSLSYAITYSAGALTLFWLCYAANKDRAQALVAALLYSLISPTCFLVPLIRADAGGWFVAPAIPDTRPLRRRSPHQRGRADSLVILVLHGALSLRNRIWIALAPFALAAMPLMNWPGSMGLTMAVLAYCLSQIGAFRAASGWR